MLIVSFYFYDSLYNIKRTDRLTNYVFAHSLTVLRKLMRLHLIIHYHLSHGLVGWIGAHADQPLHLQLFLHDFQFLLMDVIRTLKYSN